MGRDRGRRT
jgi:hypothetical protein